MTDLYATAIGDLLATECTPAVVRHVESGGDWRPLWSALQASGFADALLPEDQGGAGLALRNAFGILERCGAHALPLPLPDTLLARALLAAAGAPADARPAGPIVLARGWRTAEGLHCDCAPGARTAQHVLAQAAGQWWLLPVASATAQDAGFALDLALAWPQEALLAARPFALPEPWSGLEVRTLQACIQAALVAGAAGRVLEMALDYAGQRSQFGRAIGKFQAVQHHLAVMAEQVAAARMAAAIGCLSSTWAPQPLHAAVAKARSSEAALEVARLAHAIHGAIGFTAEFDLQLFTRRLHAWRRAGGAEGGWHDAVGRALVDGHAGQALELACSTLQPPAESAP